MPLDSGVAIASRAISERHYTLVRVRTDTGTEGIGFCYGGHRGGSLVTLAVRDLLRDIVVGRDPHQVEAIWDAMYREALLHGRRGAVLRAISAVDIALWDAVSKEAGLPLYRYAGGYREGQVPAYASGGYYAEGKGPEDLALEMQGYVEMGFQAVKMKVGRVSPKEDAVRVRVVREAVAEEVPMDPAELDFYNKVTGLVREYCARRDAHEGFLLVTPQRQISSSMAAALGDWQRRAELRREDLENYADGIDVLPDQPGPLIGELLRNASDLGDLEHLYQCDSKYRRLVEMLSDYLAEHKDEKIILFSTFRATLKYLHKRLTHDGIDSVVLMGGMREPKHDVIRNFELKRGSCVLLASEVASEGVDLQFARVLINYDLPWNPMKVEQRIGRIDRIGQKSPKITIWNMMYADTIDSRIYSRLFARLGIFERALGGLEAILGDEVRKLTMHLMRGNVTREQEEERIDQTATAMVNLRKIEADLEDQADNLVAHGDYILRQVRAAREMNRWITGDDLCAYVIDFFNKHYSGCEFHQLRADELRFEIRLTEPARFDLERFVTRYRLQGKTRLAGSSTGAVQCEFKNRVSNASAGKVETISQFHPLARFVGFSVRDKGERYYPCVSCKLSRTIATAFESGDYVFAIDHWSLSGLRVIERINYSVAGSGQTSKFLDADQGESLVTLAAIHGRDWLSAPSAIDLGQARTLSEKCLAHSIREYDRFVTDTENENNDRADLQLASLERHSQRQLEVLGEVLRGHREKGRDPLVKATEGRITKLKERVSWKIRDIESNRNIIHSRRDICVGVVRVE
ncbi:MAG: hypothetical protein IH910_09805 [Proteobacteria bacterium]|nr:hypothetical protein [Pseudomonadota bacterium]